MFTVPEMAEFLFNNRKPESCAAALRLLRDDRLYFKQASCAGTVVAVGVGMPGTPSPTPACLAPFPAHARLPLASSPGTPAPLLCWSQAGRSPPMFSGRSRAQVDSIAADLRHKEVEAAAWDRFMSDIQAAQAAPRAKKPSEADWRQGPHGPRLAALEALALGDLQALGPERTLANQTLVGLGKTPSTQVGGTAPCDCWGCWGCGWVGAHDRDRWAAASNGQCLFHNASTAAPNMR